MSRKKKEAVPSRLYTAEASASRKRAKAEEDVADPTPQEGEAAIEAATVRDEEEE